MSDTIHPNEQGYEIIADRLEPVLRELLSDDRISTSSETRGILGAGVRLQPEEKKTTRPLRGVRQSRGLILKAAGAMDPSAVPLRQRRPPIRVSDKRSQRPHVKSVCYRNAP